MQRPVESKKQIPFVLHFQQPTCDTAESQADIPEENTLHKLYRYFRIRIRRLFLSVISQLQGEGAINIFRGTQVLRHLTGISMSNQ